MKPILFAILISGLLIIGAIILPGKNGPQTKPEEITGDSQNVIIDGNKQIVEITVRGGYNPRKSFAKSGIPTVIRMKTVGSLDCAAAVVIPDIGFRKQLPLTGTTDIEIPAQEPGKILNGMCAMGMYRFSIAFN